MRRLVLGVIGHVDHGKTALVRALTGIETDRLPEEKRRGISIALGFAHLSIGDTHVDFIDMPGHERFVRTMVAGATGLDAVLLVVAANEGVAPQTVEHVDIAGLLGLSRAVVAVTKTDLVGVNEADGVARAAVALARRAGLETGIPVRVSATTGKGLSALRDAIGAVPAQVKARTDDGFAYLPLDRAFSMAGHGTVATGTLRRGALNADSALELLPARTPVRIRRLQVHGATVADADPGQRVAVNLRSVEMGAVPRGAALATAGLLEASSWLTVELTTVPDGAPLRTTSRVQLLYGTDEVAARLRLLDRDELAPGETALAQLQTAEPVIVPVRERFVLRSASPAATLAGGRVLDPTSARLRRHAPGVLARLATLARSEPAGIIAAEIERTGERGTPLRTLAAIAGVGLGRVRDFLRAQDAVVDRRDLAMSRTAFAALRDQVTLIVADRGIAHPDGISRETLHALVPDAAASLLDEALGQLSTEGRLRGDNGLFRIARAGEDEARAAQKNDAAERIAAAVRQAGLSPPDVLGDAASRRLVDDLIRRGVLVRTVDRVQKREIVFHVDAIASAKQRLAPALADEPGLLVKEIGAVLGISRKYSVPLVEYLDMVRFTRRVADRRVLNGGGRPLGGND